MKIIFATNNKNKIAEMQQLLPPSIQLLSLEEIGCHEDIPETAETIEGNAILKANYISEKYRYDCFADDTGLEVDALSGAPGVHSARYAGEQKNDSDNMDKLLKLLENSEDRTAQFKTVMALNLAGEQYLFTGIVKGSIGKEKLGEYGFGYDPIFIPNGFQETFAQIPLEIKNKISHRARAGQKLIAFLKENG